MKLVKILRHVSKISLPNIYESSYHTVGRPFVYSIRQMIQAFMVMIAKNIEHIRSFYKFLTRENNHEVQTIRSVCGFENKMPHRTTFVRRFHKLPQHILSCIRQMAKLFLKSNAVNVKAIAVDSSALRAHGNVWHKKDKEKGIKPKCGNIDKDADWGWSRTKNFYYGYKLHLACLSQKLAIPTDVKVTPANVYDNQVFPMITTNLPEKTKYVIADTAYDDQRLYELIEHQGKRLIAPFKKIGKNVSKERKLRLKFYQSKTGQKIYAQRAKTIEPLFGHLKQLFPIDPLIIKGLENVTTFVYLCVLFYQLAIWQNIIDRVKPVRSIKYIMN